MSDLMSRPAIVYKAVNVVNGKKYVGVTTKPLVQRGYEHRVGKSWIGAAIRKYGKDKIAFSTVAECQTLAEAFALERRLVEMWKPEYNRRPGGGGGLPNDPEKRAHTLSRLAEGRQRASAARRRPVVCLTDGRRWDSAADAAIECGAVQSEIAVSARGHHALVKGLEFAYDHPDLDIPTELAARAAKRRKRTRGNPKPVVRSTEVRQRRVPVIELVSGTVYPGVSAAAKANGMKTGHISSACRKHSVARDGKMFRYIDDQGVVPVWAHGRARKVRCIETGEIFLSAAAAGRRYGIEGQTVAAVCNKKQFCRTAGGMRFEWAA